MSVEERREAIRTYLAGVTDVERALSGIAGAEWDMRPAPGKWSPRQIVHHLADSEVMGGARLRMLIGMEKPVLFGYDQDAYAARLAYDRPVEKSLAIFKLLREVNAELLERLPEEAFAREGWHTEKGVQTAAEWILTYGRHAQRHADQIRRTRGI